jgi:hypothetical protein
MTTSDSTEPELSTVGHRTTTLRMNAPRHFATPVNRLELIILELAFYLGKGGGRGEFVHPLNPWTAEASRLKRQM